MKILTLILLFVLFWQPKDKEINLKNPSFEGIARDASTPEGWYPCGVGSTPDILPGPWGVYEAPAEGDTFLGLIAREDGTWESLGQELSHPLKADNCYTFELKLARSVGYVGYNEPLKLRIWGSNSKCSKNEMLAQTVPVKHQEWKTYQFTFFPRRTHRFLIFEVHYGGDKAYRGNILIDGCSSIELCSRASLF